MTSEDIRANYVWRTMEAMGTIWSDDHCGHVTRQMAKEIEQLRRVVEAIRYPSEAVEDAVKETAWEASGVLVGRSAAREILRDAVHRAEMEVWDA